MTYFTRLAAASFLVTVLAACLHAESVCSLSVKVFDSNGRMLTNIPIELQNDRRQTVRKTLSENGVARICDFPFGEHDLVVRPGFCETRMPGFRVSFTREQKVSVILRNCSSYHAYATGCPIQIRIRRPDGSPAGGRSVVLLPWGSAQEADKYGRVSFIAPVNTLATVLVESDDEAGELRVECGDTVREINEVLTLNARSREK